MTTSLTSVKVEMFGLRDTVTVVTEQDFTSGPALLPTRICGLLATMSHGMAL
jgi:hypothetical protein